MGYIPGKWSGVTIGAGVETLSKAFVARHLAVVRIMHKRWTREPSMFSCLCDTLPVSMKGRVLARNVDRTVYLIWEAIKGKSATTEDLKGALEATRATYTAEERAIRNRIMNEIDHLLGKYAKRPLELRVLGIFIVPCQHNLECLPDMHV